jgi:hypothetical protein
MTTPPRERDGQRARERPVVAERHRRRERARRAPRRPTCRRDRERGRGDRPGGTPARLQGGSEFRVAPEWVERRASTKLDPGVTSSETARIRDRLRTGSSVERTRSRCRASAFFAAELDRPQRPSPALEVHRGLRRAHLPHAAGDAAHLLRGTEPATVGSSTPGRSPDPHPGRPLAGELLRSGIPCHRRTASRSEVGRDQVARLMAISGMWGVTSVAEE